MLSYKTIEVALLYTIQLHNARTMSIKTSTITIVYDLACRVDISAVIQHMMPGPAIYFMKWGGEQVRYYDDPARPEIQKRIRTKLAKMNKKKKKKEIQFFNQISLDIDLGRSIQNDKEVFLYTSVMIYCNGRIKLAGCKSTADAVKTVQILVKALEEIRGTCAIPLSYMNGLYYNNDTGRVYSANTDKGNGICMGKCKGFFGDLSKEPVTKRKSGDGELFLYSSETDTHIRSPSDPSMGAEDDTVSVSSEGSSVSRSSVYIKTIKFGYLKDTKVVTIEDNYLIDKCYSNKLERLMYCKKTFEVIGRRYVVFDTENQWRHGVYYRNNGRYIYANMQNEITNKMQRTKLCIGAPKGETEPWEVDRMEQFLMEIYDKSGNVIGKECTEYYEDIIARIREEYKYDHRIGQGFTIEDYSALKMSRGSLEEMHTEDYILSHLEICMLNKDFSCGYNVDRDAFLNLITNQYKMHTSYDSEKHNGMRFYYYINGKCVCNKLRCKCKTTITVYSSGKILLAGSKSAEECDSGYKFIKDIMEYHRSELERVVPDDSDEDDEWELNQVDD